MFEGHVSEKCDVYALGVIMNECLSRRRPFPELQATFQVMYHVAVKNARPELAEGMPQQLGKVIRK